MVLVERDGLKMVCNRICLFFETNYDQSDVSGFYKSQGGVRFLSTYTQYDCALIHATLPCKFNFFDVYHANPIFSDAQDI